SACAPNPPHTRRQPATRPTPTPCSAGSSATSNVTPRLTCQPGYRPSPAEPGQGPAQHAQLAARQAAGLLDEQVDCFGAAVGNATGLEVGEHLLAPGRQGAAEPCDFGNRAGWERG